MPEWIVNTATLVIVCTVVYAFFSEQLARLGLRSLILGMVRGFRILAEFVIGGVAWFGYRVLLGRPVPDSVKLPDDEPSESAPLSLPQPAIENATTGIAMPSTADNGPLTVDAPDNEYSETDNAVALAVARLILESERKPFASGKVPEARAIEVVWRCTRNSREGSVYAEARALLQSHLTRLRGGSIEYYDDMIRRVETEVKNETA